MRNPANHHGHREGGAPAGRLLGCPLGRAQGEGKGLRYGARSTDRGQARSRGRPPTPVLSLWNEQDVAASSCPDNARPDDRHIDREICFKRGISIGGCGRDPKRAVRVRVLELVPSPPHKGHLPERQHKETPSCCSAGDISGLRDPLRATRIPEHRPTAYTGLDPSQPTGWNGRARRRGPPTLTRRTANAPPASSSPRAGHTGGRTIHCRELSRATNRSSASEAALAPLDDRLYDRGERETGRRQAEDD